MPKAINIRLAQEELETIERLAGADFGPERIAMYLDVPQKDFLKEWKNPDSFVRWHYDKGRLEIAAGIALKMQENALKGNITAAQQYEKMTKTQRLQDLKKLILYGETID